MTITKDNIYYYTNLVNDLLIEKKSKYQIKVSKRCGYYAVDLFNRNNDMMICCLYAGLKARECYLYVKGMETSINLLSDF